MTERLSLELTPINPFNFREKVIIESVLNGTGSRKEIAAELNISVNTFKLYLQGRKSRGIRGLYDTIEDAYNLRPYSLHHAIRIMAGDVIIQHTEEPTFSISSATDGEKHIEMLIEGKKWILIENTTTGHAKCEGIRLHAEGKAMTADRPINIEESLSKNKIIFLELIKGSKTKMVGVYVEANNT